MVNTVEQNRAGRGSWALSPARWLLGWAGLTIGCGSPPVDLGAPEVPAPVVTTDESTAASGGGESSAGCTEITLGSPSSSHAWALSAGELQRADRLVAAAEKAVKDSAYRDVDILIELGRLELWRNGTESAARGETDVDRAHPNGQRAMAVDHGNAGGRLLLALTTASRVIAHSDKREPRERVIVLGLVQLAVQMAIDGAPDLVAAAGHTLLGYLWLDRGQPQQAAKAFDEALALDGQAVGAWVGKGHVARTQKDLSAATKAYQRALALDGQDMEARLALGAAQGCEGLQLHVGSAPLPALPGLTRDPLAPAAPSPGACPSAAFADQRSRLLCQGRAALSLAKTKADKKAAADQIVAGWRDMKQACEAGEPVCGPYVVKTLLVASHALHGAGQPAKAIALGRIPMEPRYQASQAGGLPAEVALFVGDLYYQLGIYDRAASYYERHAKQQGAAPTARAARARALAIVVALGRVDTASHLATEIARDRKLPEGPRAGAVLAAAGLIRSDRGPGAADSFLKGHRVLLDAAGLGAQATDLGTRPAMTAPSFPFLLAQAVRRLAADSRWSPAAERIAAQVPSL